MDKNIIRHLRLALDLGENELITTILRSQKRRSWSAAGGESSELAGSHCLPLKPLTMATPSFTGVVREYLKGAHAFELGGWPYSVFATLPSPFVWAMLRAQKTVDLSPKPHLSNAFTDELSKLLDIMCELPIWIESPGDIRADHLLQIPTRLACPPEE